MKAGWQVLKFGEVCELKKGKKPALSATPANGYKPYLVAKYLRGAEPVEFASASDKNSISVGQHEIIIICDGSNSGETFIGFDGILSSTMAKVAHGVELDNKFLMHFLDSLFEQFNAGKTGSAIPHLDLSALRAQNLPVPPLPEQQRIVGILDEAFDGIATAKANAELNLQNARALFESHLQSVFTQRGEGWEEKPLETVASIINGFAFKSGDFSSNSEVKCIKITNVGVREFVCETDNYLPADFATKYAAFAIKSGSIVLALTRTIISGGLKVAVVSNNYDGALLNQRVAAIITSKNLLIVPFLFAYLSTQSVVDYVQERVNTLMQPNLSINDLRLMPIPLPPVHVQEQITNHIFALREETQRLESLYQRKLAALAELKKSLLHQAFSGML